MNSAKEREKKWSKMREKKWKKYELMWLGVTLV